MDARIKELKAEARKLQAEEYRIGIRADRRKLKRMGEIYWRLDEIWHEVAELESK